MPEIPRQRGGTHYGTAFDDAVHSRRGGGLHPAADRRRKPFRRSGGGAGRRGRDTPDSRPAGAGRDRDRPVGHLPHLRGERARPLLRAGLRRGARPAVPVRAVAAAGDRHGGGDSRSARTGARHRHAAVPVPGRHDDRDAPLPRPGRHHHPGVRGRRQRLYRPDRAGARPAAHRVPASGHHSGALDAGGGGVAAPGARRQRDVGNRPRAGGRRTGTRRREGAELLHRRSRLDPRSGDRRLAPVRRDPRPVPRPPALRPLRAGGHHGRAPGRPRVVRTTGGGDAVRD